MCKSKLSIALIGCGKMGSSLLSGWEDNSLLDISVITKTPDRHKSTFPNFKFYNNIHEASLPEFSVIILAVKPNLIEEITLDLRKIAKNHIIITVAALKTLDFYSNILGPKTKIVRAMPNMAASKKLSATALLSRNLEPKDEVLVNTLFSYIGNIYNFKSEDDFNKFTAICGCGPAYFFYFVESLVKGTENLGFDTETATKLVYDMLFGSIELLKTDTTPENLRISVTSKAGITERALVELMKENKFENIIKDTIEAAYQKSRELSK